jgi:hypothetical protein
VALAFALFANVWRSPATGWIGVDGDPDTTMWSIQWVAFALTHHLNPFLTDYVFYPTGTNMVWSNADAPMALAGAVVPVTLLFGPIVSYNLLQTLALALSGWTAFLAIRRYVRWVPAALVGGLVYGFGPYAMGQAYGHMALTFGVVPPLLVILIDRLVITRDLSPLVIGAAAGLLEAFQLLVTEEFVVAQAIVVTAGLAWLAALAFVLRWRVPWTKVAGRVAVAATSAAAVFAVVASYPLFLLFFGPERVTRGPIRAFGTFVTDLYNIVIPPGETHLLHTAWTVQMSRLFAGAPVESGAYLGIVLVGVMAFTVIRWHRSRVVIVGAGMLGIALLISLGPVLAYGGHQSHLIRLPWRLMRDVPIVNEVLVERMAVYMDLFAGLLLAVFLDHAWRSTRPFVRPAAALAAAASLALMVPSLPWAASTAHVPELFQPGTAANRSFQVMVPTGSVAVILPANHLRPDAGYATLWQAADNFAFKMPEGDLVRGAADGTASLDPPPSPLWTAISLLQLGIAPPTTEAALSDVRAQMRNLGVRAVVVGPMIRQDLAVLYFNLLLGGEPVELGGAEVWPVA